MRSLLCAIFGLLISTSASAQLDPDYLDVIYKRIRTLQPYGTIYYADRPNKEILKNQYNNLTRRRFKTLEKNIADSVLILTREEQQYLISELKKSISIPLPDNLFRDSKRVLFDSLVTNIDRVNRQIIDSVHNISDTVQYLGARKKNLLHWAFSFTKPIYIRHNTIFLSYFMYYYNSGGSQFFAFYKKRDNKWTRWIYFGGGDW
jgi:hypothetical protein